MRQLLAGLFVLLLVCCGNADQRADLCERYFEPYPDLISSRQDVRPAKQVYVQGMELYAEGRYAEAAESLMVYTSQRGFERSAHLYLAMCFLAMDRPFDAELQLDHLENSNLKGFHDQIEWYTLLCWVCSEQFDRALPEAERLASLARHTYSVNARELARALSR